MHDSGSQFTEAFLVLLHGREEVLILLLEGDHVLLLIS